MSFLSALDPNLVMSLGALLLTGVTWLYHKAKGDKTESTASMIGGLVDSAIHIADVEAESHPDELRAKITAYVWMTLLKLKVPRNATTELLVNEAIEVAIARAIQAAKDEAAANTAILARAQASIAATRALAARDAADLAKQGPGILAGVSYTEVKTDADFAAAVAANHAVVAIPPAVKP